MTDFTAGLVHDDTLIGYIVTDPYEIVCVDHARDRWERVVAQLPVALPSEPHDPEPGAGLAKPPEIQPVTPGRRAVEATNELTRTGRIALADHDWTSDQLRNMIGAAPVETTDDLPSSKDLYKALGTHTTDLAAETDVRADLIQRKLEKQFTRTAVTEAVAHVSTELAGASQ